MEPLEVSYVLPLKWQDDAGLDELTFYLRWLSQQVREVIVVDGSPPQVAEAHAREWAGHVRHVKPDPMLAFRNGKAAGATTGVLLAEEESVVIADDDVRYDRRSLERVVELLRDHDIVRPQNFFDPLPWHALWDSARSLINRAVAVDFPGTLGLRKSVFERAGGYDGDVLFENLELIRTVRVVGGSEAAPLDLYVRRIPPETPHFLNQRVRQAYDEFALPRRMALWLSLVPMLGWTLRRRAYRGVAGAVGASVAVAEVGRRRAGGRSVWPFRAALFAPAWLLERGICVWLAVAERALHGGVRYADGIIERAATPTKELERRLG